SQLVANGAPFGKRLGCACGVRLSVLVEDRELLGVIEQALLLVLAVDIAQLRREGAQQGSSYGAARDERAGLAGREDLALYQHLAVFGCDAVDRFREVEDAGDARPLAPGANHFRGRPAPEE